MNGEIAVMDEIKRRVSYDTLKTIVDIPETLRDKNIEITISCIEDEDEQIFQKLRGCISHIKMTAEEARAERLSHL